MIALLGILSFMGFIVCIVITIISAIRRKNVKPAVIGIICCVAIFAICLALTPRNQATKKEKKLEQTEKNEILITETETEKVEMTESMEEPKTEIEEQDIKHEDTEEIKKVEYDNLQKVFLTITKDTIEKDILELVEEYGLVYTTQDYNGTPKSINYKIAYEHDVALQKYADSGDSLEISFNKDDGSLMYAEYDNQASLKNAIYYCYGTYWDFREKEPNNDYTGYYYYTPGESKGGITIKYNNGNSTETGYHDAKSGEDALANIL